MKQLDLKKVENMFQVIDPSEKRKIKKNIMQSMTEFHVEKILGDTDALLLYSDLGRYNTIDEVLPLNKSFKVILIRETPNSGHYIAIMKYQLKKQTVIECFNSYGLYPSADLKFISTNTNMQLGQDSRHLNILLQKALKSGYKVIYNKKEMQKYTTDLQAYNTCGRHCCLRIILLIQYSFSLMDYLKYMDYLKSKYKLNYDNIVSLII